MGSLEEYFVKEKGGSERTMLARIDERTQMMLIHQIRVDKRLEKLEQKPQFCEHHYEIVEDLHNIKTESKVLAVKISMLIGAMGVAGSWVLNKLGLFVHH